METIIALMKFYKTILDFAHWNNQGISDHWLFDDLRNEVDEVLDGCVERYLAFNKEVKYSDFLDITTRLQSSYSGFTNEDILEYAQYMYGEVKEEGSIKDMLEKHIYLLKK